MRRYFLVIVKHPYIERIVWLSLSIRFLKFAENWDFTSSLSYAFSFHNKHNIIFTCSEFRKWKSHRRWYPGGVHNGYWCFLTPVVLAFSNICGLNANVNVINQFMYSKKLTTVSFTKTQISWKNCLKPLQLLGYELHNKLMRHGSAFAYAENFVSFIIPRTLKTHSKDILSFILAPEQLTSFLWFKENSTYTIRHYSN